jgi:hypothetical protein
MEKIPFIFELHITVPEMFLLTATHQIQHFGQTESQSQGNSSKPCNIGHHF